MDIFSSLAIMKNAATNMGLQIPLGGPAFDSLGYISKSGIAGSRGNPVFIF